MRIAITGANGQLGQALIAALNGTHDVVALRHADLDLEQPDAVTRLVATGAALVIHPAAWTNVDGCARDPQRAYRVNTLGTQYVALACQQLDAPLVYVSTNEVFDGTATQPYMEYDRTNPVNPYAFSKCAGEQIVCDLVRKHFIVRVAWLFGGERNFVRTVLRLASERDELTMVADEIGSPTHATDAAQAIAQLIAQPYYGIYHVVNEGQCSRYEFARHVLAAAGRSDVALKPMALADFRRDTVVPPRTPLLNIAGAALGIGLRRWEDAVTEYVGQIEDLGIHNP